MKKSSRRIDNLEPTRMPSSPKAIQTEEEAGVEVPRTEISRGHGRSRGRGLLLSIVGSRGTSKRITDTSGKIKGEPTVPNQRRFRREKAHRQSRSVKRSCCSSPKRVSYILSAMKWRGWSTLECHFIWLPTGTASHHTEPETTIVWKWGTKTCWIVSIVDGCLTTSTGCKLLLKEVQHVSEVRLNLISTGPLDYEGYEGSIRTNTMKFCKGSLIAAEARKINIVYLMHVRICQDEVNVAADTTGELWHKWLCHIIQKGMQRLAEDNLIPEVKNVKLEKCTDCLAGKQNRTSVQARPPIRRKALLELVHTDVCQVDMKSHVGSQYFVTFLMTTVGSCGSHQRELQLWSCTSFFIAITCDCW